MKTLQNNFTTPEQSQERFRRTLRTTKTQTTLSIRTRMRTNIKKARRGLVATLQPKIAEDWKRRTCGECKWGEYIDTVHSRTADGKPFLKKCGFATWGRHTSGERITLNGCKACNQFAERDNV